MRPVCNERGKWVVRAVSRVGRARPRGAVRESGKEGRCGVGWRGKKPSGPEWSRREGTRRKLKRRKEEKGRATGLPGRPSQEEKEEIGAGPDPGVGLKMKKGNFLQNQIIF